MALILYLVCTGNSIAQPNDYFCYCIVVYWEEEQLDNMERCRYLANNSFLGRK